MHKECQGQYVCKIICNKCNKLARKIRKIFRTIISFTYCRMHPKCKIFKTCKICKRNSEGEVEWILCSLHEAHCASTLRREGIGDASVIGDPRWAGGYGVRADFIAMENCHIAYIKTSDILVLSVSLFPFLFPFLAAQFYSISMHHPIAFVLFVAASAIAKLTSKW